MSCPRTRAGATHSAVGLDRCAQPGFEFVSHAGELDPRVSSVAGLFPSSLVSSSSPPSAKYQSSNRVHPAKKSA